MISDTVDVQNSGEKTPPFGCIKPLVSNGISTTKLARSNWCGAFSAGVLNHHQQCDGNLETGGCFWFP